ncbi:DUF3105 domain-containing protein [Allosalinactinospora lopnorensis]|uniref:DUF3105 domain-containing protein n=1 Tax=Allosalinactinospora lopnorensis TaxID=1352348 RepID=UPI000623EEAB|nr:DUF3105 domain-containing protein [Allosalinactinospora lopnorensis]
MGKTSAEQRRNKAEERRTQRIKEARRRKVLKIVAGVAAVVLVVGGIAYLWYRDYDRRNIDGLAEYDTARGHVTERVDYEQSPPVGGEHFATWQDCDVYSEPLLNEFAVHSMEHGAVWIAYEPGLDDQQVEQLEARHTPGSFVLVSPYEGDMPAPIVASAWGKQLPLQDAGDERLDQFLQVHERSSDVPEPDGACSGGVPLSEKEAEKEIDGLG